MNQVQEQRRDLPVEDLDGAVALVGDHWKSLEGMSLFFTGGTGFVGTWMTRVLLRAIDTGRLSATARLLTRNPDSFRSRHPEIADHRAVALVEGDVLRDGWSASGCTHLVAGATEASAALLKERPRLMLETILDGTRRTLDEAERAGVRRALFVSSGAANGPQSPGVERVRETEFFGPDPLLARSAYAEGKRAAEMLFALAGRDLSFSVARLWAFAGPLLPLDTHFAVGNFMGDVLAARTIRILGDGTTVRSYQHPADMAAWSWICLASGGAGRAYNIGSEEAISTRDLAALVNQVGGGAGYEVLGRPVPGARVDVYVPDTTRFREEFGLPAGRSLETTLRQTFAWHRGISP